MISTVDLDREDLAKYALKVDMSYLRPRSHSVDLTGLGQTEFKQKNVLNQAAEQVGKLTNFMWDSEFFDGLFPRCK